MHFIQQKPNNSSTDAELVSLYKATGDNAVLATLYERYLGLVFGVCMKYLTDEATAKDAVMDIYEALLQKLQHHEVQNFKSWLHVLTKNHCLMQLRKTNRQEIVEIEDRFMQSADVEHHVAEEKELVLQLMERCIDTLKEEQKKTVQLFYLEEKCYQEVSDITGYELAKVRSYIQNGKRNLKICMEKNNVE